MIPKDYRKRYVWFLEMGARESRIESPAQTSTGIGGGSGTRTTARVHSLPMKTVPPPITNPVLVWPDNSTRWQRLYDVYICHSKDEADCSYAMEMLSYLEQQPEKLRCFLPMRDMLAGSPIPSEICSGLENSHCWVMLLTPHFLSDNWCRYQMHQFITQAPCSNGRLIPVIIGLSLAQYPSEVKHMYAFKDTLNDRSVFIKVKDAILRYLKEMLTVTSDQISAFSPSRSTPESSESPRKPVEKSHRDILETQVSTGDISMENLVTLDTTINMYSKIPITEKTTSDIPLRTPLTQETPTNGSLQIPVQETTSEFPLRSLVPEMTISEMSTKSSKTEQEASNDILMRSFVTRQETTSDMTKGSAVTEQDTSSSVTRQETINDMPTASTMIEQDTTSYISMRSSVTLASGSAVTAQDTASYTSMRSCMTRQQTTSDMSMESMLTEQDTTSSVTRQETINDMPTASTMIEQDTTSYISMGSSVTLARGSAVTAQDTASYTSMRSCMTRQQTTSDMSMESMLTEQDTTSSVTRQETINDMPTGSTMIEQDSTSYISMRSSVTGQETPSWLQDKCKDICTDCKCITNKDLFSHETQITTSDSGIWSMSRDLHSDCSYLYTNDEKIERKHLHSNCSEIYTSGGQTVSSQSDSECSDIYTSGNGFYSGLAESSEEKVLHSQAPSIDSHALYSDIYTNISSQDSATCPQEQQHLLNQ